MKTTNASAEIIQSTVQKRSNDQANRRRAKMKHTRSFFVYKLRWQLNSIEKEFRQKEKLTHKHTCISIDSNREAKET